MDTTTIAEVWKPVVGYEGLYEVSSIGRVRTARHQNAARPLHTIMRAYLSFGYLRVGLYKDKKPKYVSVHRLVLEAFGGAAPTPKHQCNHKNGIKNDNMVENLEWCTPSENAKHCLYTLGWRPKSPRGERNGMSKLTTNQVVKIVELFRDGKAAREISIRVGTSVNNVRNIIGGHTWSHVTGINALEGA